MALTTQTRRNKWYKSGTLLSGAAANTSGSWQALEGLFPVAVCVSGAFVGTVTLYGETSVAAPTDADANHGVLTTFTAPGTYVIPAPFEWIKAVVTGYGSGSITVSAEAQESLSG